MAIEFTHSFETNATESGYYGIQEKVAGRATRITSVSRHGSASLQLRTAGTVLNPPNGDSQVAGSQENERTDIAGPAVYVLNTEKYLAHSIYFPDAFNLSEALSRWCLAADLHQTDGVGTQALFHVDCSRWNGHIHLRAYGGTPTTEQYNVDLGLIVKNQWYDFIHHFKLHPTAGIWQTWLSINGGTSNLVLDFTGPTIYNTGSQTHYWKFANYHQPMSGENVIIHDRIVQGTTYNDVAIEPDGGPPAPSFPPQGALRYDDANRANGAIGSPSDGGAAWEVFSGTWTIDTNKISCTSATGFTINSVALQHDNNNVNISVTITGTYTRVGIIARATDNDNYMLLSIQTSAIEIWQKQFGGYQMLATAALTPASGDVYKFTLDQNNLLRGFQNDVLLVSATSDVNSTNTKHGLDSDDATTSPKFDNFWIEDNGPPSPPISPPPPLDERVSSGGLSGLV